MWLSPAGCMMFSLHVQFPFESNLGQRLPFLQHIASLAAVEAIKAKPGYEVLDEGYISCVKCAMVGALCNASPLAKFHGMLFCLIRLLY